MHVYSSRNIYSAKYDCTISPIQSHKKYCDFILQSCVTATTSKPKISSQNYLVNIVIPYHICLVEVKPKLSHESWVMGSCHETKTRTVSPQPYNVDIEPNPNVSKYCSFIPQPWVLPIKPKVESSHQNNLIKYCDFPTQLCVLGT